MRKFTLAALGLLCLGALSSSARAQEPAPQAPDSVGRCATPDSILVSGNKRMATSDILAETGILPGMQLSAPIVQRAIRNIYQTGQFDQVDLICRLTETKPVQAVLVFKVTERPILEAFSIKGPKAVRTSAVKDKIELVTGSPLDPSAVARAVQRID